MANLNGIYDPNAEAQKAFDAMPTADYPAVVVDSEMKDTKAGDGRYLELAYEITEGQFKGRKLWHRLNLKSPNQQAMDIANREFASIREATGVSDPKDSQELHYKPHTIRVEFIKAGTTKKNGYTYDRDTNEIKAWKKLEAYVPPQLNQAQPSPFAAKPETTNANGAPTWAQKAA